MTREQKLFEAARAMCDGFTMKEFITVLHLAGYSTDKVSDRAVDFMRLERAVSAYEGVPFSDGQDQDISPNAPHYNPKISGRL